MKIGLVLPSVPGYSETFFTNKIKGLKAAGHTVIIFIDSGDNENYTVSEIKEIKHAYNQGIMARKGVDL